MSDWDWGWLLKGSGLRPEDFMPPPQMPSSFTPPPPGEDSSATQGALSAYGTPTTIEYPDSSGPRNTGTPTAEDVQKALEHTEYGQDVATPAAGWFARL